ncbi:hypothetical protein GN958_ATG08073 [Phytophthora infestans]|uniref:Uncharacterized protein n=1 Tax=Phytophthora infestans TaxID=4787 RepID=A0A8S9UPM9_PHYIN|nr:hypothetical protein GN958_ATG08073 [Phytophthora infestans]
MHVATADVGWAQGQLLHLKQNRLAQARPALQELIRDVSLSADRGSIWISPFSVDHRNRVIAEISCCGREVFVVPHDAGTVLHARSKWCTRDEEENSVTRQENGGVVRWYLSILYKHEAAKRSGIAMCYGVLL